MVFKRTLQLYFLIAGGLLLLLLLSMGPLAFYQNSILKKEELNSNIISCETETLKISRSLRNYLTTQVLSAEKFLTLNSLNSIPNWLGISIYNEFENSWVLRSSSLNPELSQLYKISSSEIESSFSQLPYLNHLSSEIKLKSIKLKNMESIGLYFISSISYPTLLYINLVPNEIFQILSTSAPCNFALLDNSGTAIYSTIPSDQLKQFLISYQSITQSPLNKIQINLGEKKQHFIYESALKNVLVISQVSPQIRNNILSYISFFNLNILFVVIFILSTAYLLMDFWIDKVKTLKSSLLKMSQGEFDSHPLKTRDPLFSEIFDEIAKFSNMFLFQIRNIAKFIKIKPIKNNEIKNILSKNEELLSEALILQIELKNQDSIIFDIKHENNLKEISFLWSSLCDLISDADGFIDSISGGCIRSIWINKTINHSDVSKIINLCLRIQEITNQMNKKRFLHNSSPFKVSMGLNKGEVLLATVGGSERKEFTVFGNALSQAIEACQISKSSSHPLVLTETVVTDVRNLYNLIQIPETLNGSKLFTL